MVHEQREESSMALGMGYSSRGLSTVPWVVVLPVLSVWSQLNQVGAVNCSNSERLAEFG